MLTPTALTLFAHHSINLTKIFAIVAALATATIWALFFSSLKMGVQTKLEWQQIALFRYSLPGLLLLPILVINRKSILDTPKKYLMGMAIGAGLPFLYLGYHGIGLSNINVASTVIPGLAPILLIGIQSFLGLQTKLLVKQKVSIALIAFGVLGLVLVGTTGHPTKILSAFGLLLSASFCWALFSFCIARCGLGALTATSWILGSNAIFAFALALASKQITIQSLSFEQLTVLVTIQTFSVAIVACLLYAYSIKHLGPQKAAALCALAPAIATTMGVELFNESINTLSLALMTLVIIAIIVFNTAQPKN